MRAFVAIGLLCAVACATPAQATMPGSNGKIAFTHDGEIWAVNPDGTGEQQITNNNAANGQQYDWSPDGTRLAFALGGIWVVNADGTGSTQIVNTAGAIEQWPSWSPDGTRIAFGRGDSSTNTYKIWTVDPDGTDQTMLATDSIRAFEPHWLPDGQRIAFRGCNPDPNCIRRQRIINVDGTNEQPLAEWGVQPVDVKGDISPDGTKVVYQDIPPGLSYPYHDIYVQNLDGSGRVRLTNDNEVDREPVWSPDGTKIAFRSGRGGNGPRIFVMNADGTGLSSQPISPMAGLVPKWQPIHVSFYPRPKGATPFLAYLVPAYAQCNAPNEQHGPPLAFGSCSTPAQASSALTVGTADSNGQPAKSVSSVLFEVQPGVPATPADEADVRVDVNVTDVYEQGSLSDYTGAVTARIGLRITDKLTSGPGVAGTVSDSSLDVPVSCAPTVDTTVGSTCAVQTTVDTLIPGAVPEGKRSIWELGQIEVDDAGGAPIMRQGVFVP